MRWLSFIATFLGFCFVTLLVFMWTWRAELISRSFDLSLEKTQTKIESVTALSLHSISINSIDIQTESSDHPLHIDQILLEVRTTELLPWILLPIRSPLIIENATVVLNGKLIPLHATSAFDALFIRKVDLITPNGQQTTQGEQKGTPGSILVHILETLQEENITPTSCVNSNQ